LTSLDHEPKADPPRQSAADDSEFVSVRGNLAPLLTPVAERKAEELDWIGTSFGLTPELFYFWQKVGYFPVYLRQTSNEVTGEHTMIMLQRLRNKQTWDTAYYNDFRRRFISLLSFEFSSFPTELALSVLSPKNRTKNFVQLSEAEISAHFLVYDFKRIEAYARNLTDYHAILDLLPTLARLFLTDRFPFSLSAGQLGIMIGLGLQHKSVDKIGEEFNLPVNQILALFNKTIRKIAKFFDDEQKNSIASQLELPEKGKPLSKKGVTPNPIIEKLNSEQIELENDPADLDLNRIAELERKQRQILKNFGAKYTISGENEEWKEQLSTIDGLPKNISIKRKVDDGPDAPDHSKRKKGNVRGGKKNQQKRGASFKGKHQTF